MARAGSDGRHGGGHKVRQRGANKSGRVKAEREKQAKIARERGQTNRSGKKKKWKEGGKDVP